MKSFPFILLLLLARPAGAQEIMTIQSGTEFFIAAHTPVSFDGLALVPGSDLQLTGPQALSRAATVQAPTANPYIGRVYRFSSPVAAFSGSITIYYNDPELNGLAESGLTLNVHDGASWQAFNEGVTRDAAANRVTTDALAGVGLAELTLASENGPLPLRWLGVEAHAAGTTNVVEWTTADEVSVRNFGVQRSRDALAWSPVGSPLAAHNSAGQHRYRFTDEEPPAAVSYYRVVQTDADGQHAHSQTVSVRRSGSPLLRAYPNPATSHLVVQLQQGVLDAVEVVDTRGRRVYRASGGGATLRIPVAAWAAGVYTLRLVIDGAPQTLQFVKK